MSDPELTDQRSQALVRLATLHRLHEHARMDSRGDLLKSIEGMIEEESTLFRERVLDRLLKNAPRLRDDAVERRAQAASRHAAVEEEVLQREYIAAMERERDLWRRVKGLHPGQPGHVAQEWSEWMAAANRLQAFARRLDAQQALTDNNH